ncbi:uncharacterized protein TNCV_3602701 [Trichonephila clavipes]|nr:uncharacterized protein TNCV_3602701 [Trichonephila clavipes]
MARMLGTIISETARLLKPAVDDMVLDVYTLSKIKFIGDCLDTPSSGRTVAPQCTVGYTQAGGGSNMLWGTFSWAFLEPMAVVEQTMNATGYLNIIADQLQPYKVSVFPAYKMEYSNRIKPCVTRLKECWSGSRNMMLNSS